MFKKLNSKKRERERESEKVHDRAKHRKSGGRNGAEWHL